MAKDRRSITLDPEVSDYLSKDGVNASALINKLVREYMAGGDTSQELRRLRIQQTESEIENLEMQMEQRRKELERLRELEKERKIEKEADREEALDEAATKLTPDRWLKGASRREQIPDIQSDEVSVVYSQADVDMDKSEFYHEVMGRILDE